MIHQAPFSGPGPVPGLQTQSEQSRDLGAGMKQMMGVGADKRVEQA